MWRVRLNSTFITNLDVAIALEQVRACPDIWNRNPARTLIQGPHREVQDIVLRYKDETEHLTGGFGGYNDAHTSEWYSAIDELPAVKTIVYNLAAVFQAEQIGGVFLYRVPPGKQVYPHNDTGWHPEFYSKFNVCLESNESAFFGYKDEFFTQIAGDVHYFRNDKTHGVVNGGATDHTVLIVCLRLDSGYRVPPSDAVWVQAQKLKGVLPCQE
jgi:hypothetical protein